MPLALDPSVAAAAAALLGGKPPPPTPPVGDIATRRINLEGLTSAIPTVFASLPTDVNRTDYTTRAEDGHEIGLRWFVKDGSAPGSAVLWIHGGGFIASKAHHWDVIVQRYVHYGRVPLLAVDFRNAPEAPHPIGVGDCYAALLWLHAHAAELGVDPNRIGVMGESGGGGLAAALAHLVRLKGDKPKIAKQILNYPMLDDRNIKPDPMLAPFAMWAYESNETGWTALLAPKYRPGDEDVPVTAAPARMTVEDAKDLPPVYIEVGELDIFRDEVLEYVRKLAAAGNSCEFHLWPAVHHGFDLLAPLSQPAQRAMEARCRVFQSL